MGREIRIIKDGIGHQIAALPLRTDEDGKLSVLMVTSRDTGRWVMPKGWRIDGLKQWAAAEVEALEEAGAEGFIASEKIGFYTYNKILDNGTSLPCRVNVYPMMVNKLKSRWKERRERKRRWFSIKAAARRVDEPELAILLLTLSKEPLRQPVIRELLKAS